MLPAGPDADPLGLADSMLGWSLDSPPPVGVALALGVDVEDAEPEAFDGVGEADPFEGEGDPDPFDGDGEPEPFDGLAEADPFDGDWLELGGGVPDWLDDGGGVVGTGGCGGSGGAFMNSSTAIRSAMAATSSSNNQLASMLTQPARCGRPGQGSGHNRLAAGASRPSHDSR